MANKTYSQLLKDPRWQKKRLDILNRDEFTCQMCGSTESTLHIHHITYHSGNPWEISDDLLITLCADCHEHETEAVKHEIYELIKTLKGSGMISIDFMSLSDIFKEVKLNWRYPPTSDILKQLLTDDKYYYLAEKDYFEKLKEKSEWQSDSSTPEF